MTEAIPAAGAAAAPFLERVGLHRPELRAWVLYDCANSAFWATVILIFPFFYADVACAGLPKAVASSRYAWSTAFAMAVIAVLSPVLGAIADHAGLKKKMLGGFMALGVAATAAMYFIDAGEWRFASLVFIVANIGVAGSIVFYEALLPHVARQDELDRVSSAGYSVGYLGSALLMAVNLLWIQKPQWFGIADSAAGTRLSFVSVAVWWALFSIPILRKVKEPRRHEDARGVPQSPIAAGFTRLGGTFRELRLYRQAFLLLIAFLIYNDGIGTIIRMASPYAAEIGIPQGTAAASLLIVQIVGVPFAVLFGLLAGKIGAQRGIYLALAVFISIAIYGYFMRTPLQFFTLCVLVGMVMGGAQALSRSLFASMVPRHKSAEFFAFYGVLDKFAGVIGPAMFAAVIEATGSSRNAILGVIAFFVTGGILLSRVDVVAGQRAAREAEASE
jgi:UMF1 family MFS transporter